MGEKSDKEIAEDLKSSKERVLQIFREIDIDTWDLWRVEFFLESLIRKYSEPENIPDEIS